MNTKIITNTSLQIPVWGLFIFVLLAILYFAKAVFIPVFLAILTSFILNPVVAVINKKLRIPCQVGAAVVLIFLSVFAATAVNSLADPASMWFERLPKEMHQVELKLSGFRKSIENVQETTETFGKIAVGDNSSDTQEVVVRGPNLFYKFLDNTQSLLIALISYVVLLYLLLAFGNSLARDIGNMFKNKSYSRALMIVTREARSCISYYLLVITAINIVLGCLVTLAMWAAGMPNPMVWGASAALLNYIPYVGPAINFVIVAMVSLLTFDTISQVVIPPLLLLGINLVEGQIVQPLTVGRVFTINPVVVFISIIIWGWLWGAAGIFMAVPILMVCTIILERSLKFRQQKEIIQK